MKHSIPKLYTLTDCWGNFYFNDDGTVNSDCCYFNGVNQENKDRILNEYFNLK